MSDEEKAKSLRRYLGKVRNMQSKNGPYQKIYMDNLEHTNKDGTPNKYYKGALVWMDAETNRSYHVKQMSFWVPREGMDAKSTEKGYTCFITLNLEDEYEVTILG